MTLPELINATVDRLYGGVRTRLAEEMGVSISFLGKVVEGRFRFSVENCLVFAEKTGVHPKDVLEAAGHTAHFARIERLFGRAHPSVPLPLSGEERALLRVYRRLAQPVRESVLYLCRSLTR